MVRADRNALWHRISIPRLLSPAGAILGRRASGSRIAAALGRRAATPARPANALPARRRSAGRRIRR
jgi:hypothetical protein